jgi:predicted amidohydrolase
MTVGDLDGNTQKLLSYMQQAHVAGAHSICFPELALTYMIFTQASNIPSINLQRIAEKYFAQFDRTKYF